MKKLAVSVAFLGLAGCGTTQPLKESSEAVEAREHLKACMASTYVRELARECFNYKISSLGENEANQAKQRWASFLSEQEPDVQLLGAVLRKNISGVRDALSKGANPNRVFENHQITSHRSKGATTPLFVAFGEFDPELVDILLAAGADPGWSESGSSFDVVSNYIARTSETYHPDGRVSRVTGLELSELAYNYGYKPSARDLRFIGEQANRSGRARDGDPNLKPFYKKLFDRADPTVKRELVELDTKASQAAANSEARRAADLAKEQQKREEARESNRAVEAQRVASMRKIGSRICMVKGSLTYVGYVEGIATEKVQIRITQAVFTNAPGLSPGGFQPSIIWDRLDRWFSCE